MGHRRGHAARSSAAAAAAAFATGQKWAMAAKAEEKTRYIICNADEGDPGAFMDRSMLESDPLNVIEGMMIGGYAIGAQRGFFYVRAEYPMAIRRIQHAIDQCRAWGLLGKNILGSGFDFDLEIRLGAGAFVCGEETALIHSIEGQRGQPRIRPPYPTESGLWGKPTVINNVETFANVPAVINYGADWFSRIGTRQERRHQGLRPGRQDPPHRPGRSADGHHAPRGRLRHRRRRGRRQAAQGHPDRRPGRRLHPRQVDRHRPSISTRLAKAGSIMGSGGMIILDEDDCMVDIAKFYVTFSQDESCGKCTPCREGSVRMLEILERITSGHGTLEDLDKLKRLGLLMKKTSLCGLGRAAPNPVLSTLEHFHDEYLAHVVDKKCPAHRCTQLIHYEIDAEKCVGCTLCGRNCPVECISGDAEAAARDRPAHVHQVRAVFRGLPVRRGEEDVRILPTMPLILLTIPGLREKDVAVMPQLREMTAAGQIADLVPSFPCVTCPVQANMTTGRLPAAHGVVANGLLLAREAAGRDVDRAERLHRAAADLGPALARGRGADLGRLVSHAQRRLRGRLRLHARADPQSRRLASRSGATRGRRSSTASCATRWAISPCSIFGGRWPTSARRPGSPNRRRSPRGGGSPISSGSICRTSTTPPRSSGPTAPPPRPRSASWTPNWAGCTRPCTRPTATTCSGSWPASTPSRRSITSPIPTACSARPGC